MTYSISISNQELSKIIRLRACIVTVLSQLQQILHSITMHETVMGDRVLFEIHHNKGNSVDKELRKNLGEGIAEFICDCMEPEMIRRIIRHNYQYYCSYEIGEIEKVVNRLLEGSAWEYARVVYVNRREKLAKQIFTYLKENKDFAVDGFTQFRLVSYKEALSKCVKEAIDEYVVELEYREFIGLLRSFVAIQTPIIDLVHVLHKEKNQFHVLREDGTRLKARELQGVFKEVLEQSFSHEDIIVSTLLSALPEKVILHTTDPEETLVRTLLQVFQGRIALCDGCNECGLALSSHGDT